MVSVTLYMGFQHVKGNWKCLERLWKAYVTEQEHPAGMYHPSLQGDLLYLRCMRGIIMRKIVIAL
jgi:hypothetical protein